MNTNEERLSRSESPTFYDKPGVQLYEIPEGGGIPMGIELVSHSETGIGGAYGAWGQCYDNQSLSSFIESLLDEPLKDDQKLDLSPLGFVNRHHVPVLSNREHLDVEVEAGARFLAAAAQACGWEPQEVDAVLVGMSGPISENYTEVIAKRAGIPDKALKVSVHKACDGSVGGLHLVLNPELEEHRRFKRNIAKELHGKKVLVGA